jgi:hypothetical protein
MKKNFKFVAVSGLLTASLFFGGIHYTFAAEKDTKEKALKAYENILVNNPYEDYDGGFTADSFNILDITGDDIPELIINEDAPNIFTYQDGQVVWLYNSWVLCNMYYSEKTKNLMYSYSWKGVSDYTIYKYDSANKELVSLKNLSYEKKTYYVNNNSKKTKITKTSFNKCLAKYVPGKVKLETPYKNTEENRAKYLK